MSYAWKDFFQPLLSFSCINACLLKAVSCVPLWDRLCGPFWHRKLRFHKSEIHYSVLTFACAKTLLPGGACKWFRHILLCIAFLHVLFILNAGIHELALTPLLLLIQMYSYGDVGWGTRGRRQLELLILTACGKSVFFSLKDLFLATSKKKLSDGIYFIKQQNYVHIEQRKAIYSYLVFLRAYIET